MRQNLSQHNGTDTVSGAALSREFFDRHRLVAARDPVTGAWSLFAIRGDTPRGPESPPGEVRGAGEA